MRRLPASFLRRARPDRFELGRAGEALAAHHLARSPALAGTRLVGRGVRTPGGEVDLVFAGARELVCVEVKTGLVSELHAQPSALTRPGRRFDERRWRRQQRAAHLLARDRAGVSSCRVDLVEVLVERSTGHSRLLHHSNLKGGFGRRPAQPQLG